MLIMRKGVTGKVLTTVITLIMAVSALLVLWLIMSGYLTIISTGLDQATFGLRILICCDVFQCKPALGQEAGEYINIPKQAFCSGFCSKLDGLKPESICK